MISRQIDDADPGGSFYGVLGVSPEASRQAIVHAYRQQARASHPDARPGDPAAPTRFRMLTRAYEVLSDPVQRADYDRSLGRWPRREGLEETGSPQVDGSNPEVILDAVPLRPSRSPLWAGPVRVEALPRGQIRESRGGPLGFRHLELDGLTPLLLRVLTERWLG